MSASRPGLCSIKRPCSDSTCYAWFPSYTPHHKRLPFDEKMSQKCRQRNSLSQWNHCGVTSPHVPAACRRNCGAVRCVTYTQSLHEHDDLQFLWEQANFNPTKSKPPNRSTKNFAQLITYVADRCVYGKFGENLSTGDTRQMGEIRFCPFIFIYLFLSKCNDNY